MRAAFIPSIIAALVAFTLSACSKAPDPDSLYPLEPGLSWTYRIDTQRKGSDATHDTRIMSNVKRMDFGQYDGLTVRRNNFGTRYYVAELDDGLYRIATKSIVAQHPIMAQPPLKILPLPAKKGASWREPTHTYMLERAKTFITADRDGNGVVLDYTIETSNARVKVPAGTYDGCTLAVGKTTFHLGSGVGFAATDIPIVQKEWYCPGVGLVRLSRDERVTSDQKTITGGHMELRLVDGPQ